MNDQARPKWKALNDQFDTVELETPKPKQGQSEKQRLRVSVPYLQTAITMGAGALKGEIYSDDQCVGALHYEGFGVTTQGHVHIEAKGTKDAKTHVKIQSRGDITLHSNESGINIGGKDAVLLGTEGGASMIGGSGVVIAGGAFGLTNLSDKLQEPVRGEQPATPQWVQSMGSLTSGIGTLLDAIDFAVGRRRDTRSAQKSRENLGDISLKNADKASMWAGRVGDAMTGLGLFYNAVDTMAKALPSGEAQTAVEQAGDVLSDAAAIFSGTSIWGASGIVLGTPATMGIYSLGGTSIFSPFSVSVDSTNLVSLSSRKALSMISEGTAELNAADHLFVIGGKVLRLGSNDRASLAAQRHMMLQSCGSATLAVQKDHLQWVGGTTSLYAQTYALDAEKTVEIHGKNGAVVHSAQGGVSLVADEGVAAVAGAGGVKLHSNDAIVDIGSGKITLTVGAKKVDPSLRPIDLRHPEFDDVNHNWDSAAERDYFSKFESKQKDWNLRASDGEKKIGSYHKNVAGATGNTDDGIEITKGNVVIAAGGFTIKLSSSDCKVGEALKVSS